MFAPGLISLAFYRRRPSRFQIGLGLGFTVAFSGLLGYLQAVYFPSTSAFGVWENTLVAIVVGVAIYFAILAYLWYVYFPKHEHRAAPFEGARPEPPP